ncbi:hypothetical protein [Streptomyces sp. NPDC126503]|uniref:hypothetical protein n=1 Tax=Streptomyces sp. NPDC126503 TaxID=3155315 RepID=UPI00331B26AE
MRPLLPSRPFPRRPALPRLPRGLRRALTGLVAAGLAVGGLAVWFGAPYPAADPEASAARLKAEAGRVLEEARLPPGTGPVHNGVETGTCYYRGLRSLAHIDQGRPDVRSFELSWRVTGVPEKTAADAQERTRRRLTAAGWTRVSESGDDRGFRFEHPDSGEKVDVGWWEPTGTYAVSVYAPCGRLPEGFDPYHWTSAEWFPGAADRH